MKKSRRDRKLIYVPSDEDVTVVLRGRKTPKKFVYRPREPHVTKRILST